MGSLRAGSGLSGRRRFGLYLKIWRCEQLLTLRDVALTCRTAASTLWRIEHGDSPKLILAQRIAKAFGQTLPEFLLMSKNMGKTRRVSHQRDFGRYLKMRRDKRLLTLRDVARTCRTTATTLLRIEHGDSPQLTLAERIAHAFGQSLPAFLTDCEKWSTRKRQ